MAELTADEQQALLIIENLIRLDKPIDPFPDGLLERGLVWRDVAGRVHMTVAGLRAAKAARAASNGRAV